MILLTTGPASPRQLELVAKIEALPYWGGFLGGLMLDHVRGKQLTFGQMDMADQIISERKSK